ncbi:hypothetical protein E2C01_018594 [Portunus trituberculatus]|uniref:Uncharacterized protein n=1 Tax=Portunus trituberculatus TaxID=210409 RepID=A0A5B7DWK5_PORTR|nr:hypothetical protein [Portunus trituberculatus]
MDRSGWKSMVAHILEDMAQREEEYVIVVRALVEGTNESPQEENHRGHHVCRKAPEQESLHSIHFVHDEPSRVTEADGH